MRILQIVNGLDIGSKSGGAAQFALELSAYLHDRGEEVHVAALYRFHTSVEQYWENQIRRAGMDVIYLNSNQRLNLLRTIGTLRNECVIRHIELLHTHTPVGSLAGIFIKWGTPYLKMVRTEHTPIPWGTSLLGNISRFLFTNLLFPICIDMEVGVSPPITDMLNRRAGVKWSHRSAIWIPPVLPDMYRRRLDDPYKAEPADGQYVIGSVGSLRKIKGYDDLLRAIALVREIYPAIKLMLVGDGEERRTLEELSNKLGLRNQVQFMGARYDVPDLLGMMDLFVLPSFIEGLPTTILESWAIGTPVIGSDIPGIRAILTDGQEGWLVMAGDFHALAQKIITVLANLQERNQVRANGRQAVMAYTMEKVGSAYQDLYANGLP
ncbi:MAG TPA: glycosyltransferase family 4 protein [Anaerolineaceae bacterium]|mgnify:CR=1 FL=1|nr:glycosyltransferase family 4 protein [Anaerolineaceae bacterium]HNZ01965.1 glycosyltransferase family 4 protein [Anaerolineaceae bacterium]HOD44965.1 glycosyltransferase family 4 protein [Anaerolineaceae bacterium]HOH20989.1 glycosyltransferase family 4 protein [Anaerolineaceae bacterium]HOU45268.1 glycosyltransferase family 4 protein [Anaerolineaceae bacterium]